MRRKRYNSRRRMHISRTLSFILITLFLCASAHAQWDAPAAELARQVAPLAGSGTASLSLRNLSSLPQDQVPVVRRSIESQLRSAGVQIRTSGVAANEIRVTLSENVRGWVWVAEIQQGGDVKTTVITVPRGERAASTPIRPAVTLNKTLLISRAEPILDVAILKAGNEIQLVVLDGDTVDLMRPVAGKWETAQSFNITHTEAFPRDARGRIVLASDHLFDAYLPGVYCAAIATAPISMTCHESDDPWPIAGQKAFFNSARNYFTGVLSGLPTKLPPFFAIAAVSRGNGSGLLLTGIDGQAQLWDGSTLRALPNTRDWGSDIATVRSGCSAGTQVLVTGSGDDTATDSLRAYEIGDTPIQVSAPNTFDGPIMSLWPTGDESVSIATIHNLLNGQYEAYSVAVACNQ